MQDTKPDYAATHFTFIDSSKHSSVKTPYWSCKIIQKRAKAVNVDSYTHFAYVLIECIQGKLHRYSFLNGLPKKSLMGFLGIPNMNNLTLPTSSTSSAPIYDHAIFVFKVEILSKIT